MGSGDFEGTLELEAGSWKLEAGSWPRVCSLVSVRTPATSSDAVRRVTVRAIQWNLGPEGAPPADVASVVPGDAGLYSASLWLMVPTSYRVLVVVDGVQGAGTATVPFMALATAQRPMPRAISMAAQQKFKGAMADPHAIHRAITGSEVSIPYAFPKAGRYRIWIQMKRAGQIVTGAFEGTVR